jgi:hypothetical protein
VNLADAGPALEVLPAVLAPTECLEIPLLGPFEHLDGLGGPPQHRRCLAVCLDVVVEPLDEVVRDIVEQIVHRRQAACVRRVEPGEILPELDFFPVDADVVDEL